MKRRTIFKFLKALFICMTILLLSCGGCNCFSAKGSVTVNTTSSSGSIQMQLKGIQLPRQGERTQYLSVVFTGGLVGNSSGSGRDTFQVNRTHEATSTGINPAPLHTRTDLKPGKWTVTATLNNWSATGQGTVYKNKTTTFIFTYNRQNVTVK